jgi:hypothetical protein
MVVMAACGSQQLPGNFGRKPSPDVHPGYKWLNQASLAAH